MGTGRAVEKIGVGAVFNVILSIGSVPNGY